MKNVSNKLRVSHYPQVPCKPFIIEVKDEEQAAIVVKTMALQHLFLYDNNFIPDYCNAILVEMFEDGEWVDYYNEEEGMDWDEIENEHFNN